MGDRSDSINPKMGYSELRDSWQGRALAMTRKSSPKFFRVLCSVMCDNYDDTMPFLLAAVFNGFWGLYAPHISTAPKIDKAGRIVADLVTPDDVTLKNYDLFDNEKQMEGMFRKLADRLRLDDAERIDMFIALRHWVKADLRLDPAFDRRDPDAKRMVLH